MVELSNDGPFSVSMARNRGNPDREETVIVQFNHPTRDAMGEDRRRVYLMLF
jgi:hypothetical protein